MIVATGQLFDAGFKSARDNANKNNRRTTMVNFTPKWRQAALAIIAITLLLVLPNLTRMIG